ncbi:hypothetical protein [Rhodococcus sp. AH-ZY2]|uniref:hypothetical protein n=1 Tax=Rhodococcus sp. AH-ZY2 TaxID=3047468 RepID=UPI0027E12DC3|nr:hypothetical protein [Rhodococcus sp. AH-ZY2]WML63639.1 hypothetical protein QNA09_02135 [Rhodococcus sp. AH-ZY2]
MNIRRTAAWKLRHLADHIDPTSGPRALSAHFNMVPGEGMVITQTFGIPIHPPAPGCPLWYMAEDYDRAWKEHP